MRTKQAVLAGITMAMLAGPWTPARSETPLLGLDAECGVASAFVWRGFTITDEACLQPSLTFTGESFSFDIWSTWDLSGGENSSEHTRVDASLDYTMEAGRHIFSLGVIGYMYPDAPGGRSRDTVELFGSYAFDILLLPSFILYYDVDNEGAYMALAVAHSIELHERVALDLSLSLGAADERYAKAHFALVSGQEALFTPSDPVLVDLTGRVTLAIRVTDRLLVTPGVKFVSLADPDLRTAADLAELDKERMVAGVSARWNF